MKINIGRTVALVIALVALLAAPLQLPGTASTAAESPAKAALTRQSAKPTVVLVHGAWADASGWKAEVASLTRQGYPVIAPATPLRGLASDAAYLRSILQTIPGPVVLVGHSYGGAVITNAATGLANVKALVYIAAFVPDQGEPVAQLVGQFPGSLATEANLEARPYPLGNGEYGVDLYLKKETFREAFAGDLPVHETTIMQVTQRPFSLASFTEPSATPAWRTIPSWYLLATDDKTIPPAAQAFMSKRAGSTVVRVRSSHVAMQSHPAETLALIEKAIRSVR
jgi:pimeloyl-ACP methyl ester carboxylesterase